MISDRFLESRVWDTVAWAWLSQAGGIQSNSTHFNICHLILFIVTNTFSIIMWRQNRLDMYRNNYVAKKAESFLVPSYYLLLLGKMMSWPESCVKVSCHGGASQKDWERVLWKQYVSVRWIFSIDSQSQGKPKKVYSSDCWEWIKIQST